MRSTACSSASARPAGSTTSRAGTTTPQLAVTTRRRRARDAHDAHRRRPSATDREVIFRTWSVGVGAVGDMHTNPASYEAVLGGIDSPALIVSTKYTLGDFYSYLPLNDTLEHGQPAPDRRVPEPPRVRELRRVPQRPRRASTSDALQRLLAANPHIEGIWTWTQDGGPWRAGPMTLYLKAGFWQLYELNTVARGVASRATRTPTSAAITAGLGAAVVLRRPGDRATRSCEAMAGSRDGDRPGPVHRARSPSSGSSRSASSRRP